MSWLQRHSSGVRHLLFYCNLMALLSPGATRQSPLYHMAIISAALFCDLLTLSTVTCDPLKPNKTHASLHPCAAPSHKRKPNALRATPYLHAIRLFLLPPTFYFFDVFGEFVCNWKESHQHPRAGRSRRSQRTLRALESQSLQQGEMFPNASLQSSSSLSSTHTSSLLAPVKPFSLLPFIYRTCGLMHLLGRRD